MINRVLQKISSLSDLVFYLIVYLVSVFALIITLYPFLYTISMSFSVTEAVNANKVWLYPVGFTLQGYKKVFENKQIFISFYNTLLYTVAGTAANIVAICLAAYPLSKANFCLRKPLNMLISFSMYFSAGMMPNYILLTSMGFYNNRLVMIIPSLVITGYVMMCRSAFSEIPLEMTESARIDGAGDWTILLRIAVPLVRPTLAVLTLYCAVFHWNDFFTPMIYITDSSKEPMQLLLRRVVVMASNEMSEKLGALMSNVNMGKQEAIKRQIRYVTIVVSTVPILVAYPFLQRYFVRGIMVGAIKG